MAGQRRDNVVMANAFHVQAFSAERRKRRLHKQPPFQIALFRSQTEVPCWLMPQISLSFFIGAKSFQLHNLTVHNAKSRLFSRLSLRKK
jgi:hypothetical protein